MMEEKTREYYCLLGENIMYARKQAKVSRNKVAKVLGVQEQLVRKYEVGAIRIPIDKLFDLAFFYKVHIFSFFVGIEKRLEQPADKYAPMYISKSEVQKQINRTTKKIEEKLKELKSIHDSLKKDL